MTVQVLYVWDDDVKVLRLTSLRGTGPLKRPRDTGVISRKDFARLMQPSSIPPVVPPKAKP